MLTVGHPTDAARRARRRGHPDWGHRAPGSGAPVAGWSEPWPAILFTSARQAGFVLPLLQLVRAMVARGDEVMFLGGEAHRERIEEAGALYVRLPYDADVPPGRVRRARPRGGVREMPDLLGPSSSTRWRPTTTS